MADKIQTMIPLYGELNRIYRDYIDNHIFSFDRQKFISDFCQQYSVENPLKVVPLIHSNLTPVKFSHSPFCLFLFSSYSSCPLCRVLH